MHKGMTISPPNLHIEKLKKLNKNDTNHKSMEAVRRLRLHARQRIQRKPRTAGKLKLPRDRKGKNSKKSVNKKEEDHERVKNKNAANVSAANKNFKTISSCARKAGATLVENDVAEKTRMMVVVVNTVKPLGIQVKSSGSMTKTGEMMKRKSVSFVFLDTKSTRKPSGIQIEADAITLLVASTTGV